MRFVSLGDHVYRWISVEGPIADGPAMPISCIVVKVDLTGQIDPFSVTVRDDDGTEHEIPTLSLDTPEETERIMTIRAIKQLDQT